MRRMTVLLVAVLSALTLTACGGKGNALNIPDEYRKEVVLNGFKTLWSTTEDGSDWIGSVQFTSDCAVPTEIMRLLDGARLSPVDNSGNFMPDFSFTTGVEGQNGYDFVFTSDDQLILRDPNGVCSKVDIAPDKLDELKDYIAALRLAQFPVTP